jgi:hypothetical protein
MNIQQKIIFGYYLHKAKINHICIKYNVKKLIIVPFNINIESCDGYFKVTEDNLLQCQQFFSFSKKLFMVTDGIDCLTGLKQSIPLFLCNFNNVNLFTSILFVENLFGIKGLHDFIGYSISEYNYIKCDIFYDYFNSPNQHVKKLSFIAIQKYCLISFMINYVINFKNDISHLEYINLYYNIVKLIQDKLKITKINNIFNEAKKYFKSQNDVITMIIYSYAPKLTTKENFNFVFNVLSYQDVKKRLQKIHFKNYLN